jgi:DNA replication protein DnaC
VGQRNPGEWVNAGPAATVHQRYKLRRSLVITSNRVVQDWVKYLGDATMGTTILARLMHRAVMLEFEGKSYRLKEAAARLARPCAH